uniref:hypothetical protein n=1 Tax=Streptomyces tauricus TaxID=68274 RepID=UPI0037FEDF37
MQVITDLHVILVQNPLAVALPGDHPGFRGARAGLVHRWFSDNITRSSVDVRPQADDRAVRAPLCSRHVSASRSTAAAQAPVARPLDGDRLGRGHGFRMRGRVLRSAGRLRP